MPTLTHTEIELLQYALLCHMRDSGNESSSLKSLYNKLVDMRCKSSTYHKELSNEEINNSL